MLKTSTATQAAARHSNRTTSGSLERFCRRVEAIHALPRPMPRMNAMSTTANDCNEGPKIKASEREATTSSPMETPPVNATIRPAQRKVPGATIGLSPVASAGLVSVSSCAISFRLSMMARDTDDEIRHGAPLPASGSSRRFAQARNQPAPLPARRPGC